MVIIISKNWKDAKLYKKEIIEKEDFLQKYLFDNPQSIPINEIKDDVDQLFIVKREFHTDSGPIDALGLDREGDIYIIETKLHKNADKRQVIAQALDYGAALTHEYDGIKFTNRLKNEVKREYGISLMEKLQDEFEGDENSADLIIKNIEKNLDNKNFIFIILMDKLDERLKRLISFYNSDSSFRIYALEEEYYKFDSYEIMTPKFFGIEKRKKVFEAGEETEIQRKWHEFYTKLVEEYKKIQPEWKTVSPKPNWALGFGSGKTGITYQWVIGRKKAMAILVIIDRGNESENEQIFQRLKSIQEIKNNISDLCWEKPKGKRRTISINKPLNKDVKSLQDDEIDELVRWAAQTMKKVTDVFSPHINKL